MPKASSVAASRALVSSSFLIGSSLLAVLIACGPEGGGQGPNPPTTGTPSSSVSVPAPPTSSATAATSSTASATASASASTPPAEPMKPIAKSEMETKLREIGLDPKALPPLNKLDYKKRNDVMNTFTKALGVQCTHCHVDNKDFKTMTPNKKIATHMWNELTRALAITDGSVLYCDSCHQGKAVFLDRKNITALSTWMQENYVDKMKRVDKKENGCETCHGDPMEPKIFANVWKIAR